MFWFKKNNRIFWLLLISAGLKNKKKYRNPFIPCYLLGRPFENRFFSRTVAVNIDLHKKGDQARSPFFKR